MDGHDGAATWQPDNQGETYEEALVMSLNLEQDRMRRKHCSP
jgi:hypothetical protein